MDETRRERAVDGLWFLFWALLSSWLCLTTAQTIGVTFDEPIYVTRGLERWRTGSVSGLLQLGTMPLPVEVCTLPLYLYERWHGITLDPHSDLVTILPWARAATLVFWWLLLGYGRLLGRCYGGPWGGRLAVALLAAEPCFQAHASLATTDIAITAMLLALVYHFRQGRDASWGWRIGLPALCFATALLAKASGLVFGPLCLLAVEVERLWQQGTPARDWWNRGRALARDLVQIGLIGLGLVFVYCGSDWQPEPSFVKWAHTLPDNTAGRSMVWLSEHLRIFSNAGEGIARQIKHNIRGHGTYLLGASHARAIWYYFPVALAIKLTLPLLLLPLAVVALRPGSLRNGAMAAAAVLLVFSLNCRVQIGIRLVLPLIALTVIGLAAALARILQEDPSRWRRAVGMGIGSVAVCWAVASSWLVWPHSLRFANALWGGTENCYRCLSDSNHDWGQGLPELARWQTERAIEPLAVWYFGTDPRIKQNRWREIPYHILPVEDDQEVLDRAAGSYLAVSTTLLHGQPGLTPSYRRAAAFLRTQPPVDRTATFLIFDFRNVETSTHR